MHTTDDLGKEDRSQTWTVWHRTVVAMQSRPIKLTIKDSPNASSMSWQIVLWSSLVIRIIHMELSDVCHDEYYCNIHDKA